MTLMATTHNDFRVVFWVAVLPAFAAVFLIIFGVKGPKTVRNPLPVRSPIRWGSLSRLERRFWRVGLFTAILTLARFSEAFFLLRAEGVGVAVSWAPLVLIVMNVVYAASAYPLGRLSDRMSLRILLVWGVLFLIAADIVLAFAGNFWMVALGSALWGVHMGKPRGSSRRWSPTPRRPIFAAPLSASPISLVE